MAPSSRSEPERCFGSCALGARSCGSSRQWRCCARPEFPEQPGHVFAEAIVMNLEFVPRRVPVRDAMADIRRGARLHLAEPSGVLWIRGKRHDEARDQLRLVISELPHAAFRRLEQANHEQIVMLAIEGVDEEL